MKNKEAYNQIKSKIKLWVILNNNPGSGYFCNNGCRVNGNDCSPMNRAFEKMFGLEDILSSHFIFGHSSYCPINHLTEEEFEKVKKIKEEMCHETL